MLFQTPPINLANQVIISITEKKEVKEPQLYTIKQNDTLSSISAATGSSVERLWQANTELANPDIIKPGDPLKIPDADEVLVDRPMPVLLNRTILESPITNTVHYASDSNGGSPSSGNTYYWGQCVWYIKNIVPWVENGWGNGSDWVYTSGHMVSSTPAVGTVASAISYNHVALVTTVTESSVIVSEMNYKGLGVESTRTAPISEFEYIYP